MSSNNLMIHYSKKALSLLSLAVTLAACSPNATNISEETILIKEMGSFSAGGTHNGTLGLESLSCDHGHVEYTIPANPRSVGLMMWHSSSAGVWQNRWDGGEGFQSMFLKRDYPVYLWEGPRVGRANWGCESYTYTPFGSDQRNFLSWRLGTEYPNWFEGVQFPTNNEDAWDQAVRTRYNEFDTVPNGLLQAEAAAAAADKIGPVVAITSSAGGWRALLTRLKTDNLVGIVSYETPGVIFPEGEGLEPNLEAAFGPLDFPLEEFMRLTEIPIQIVFGDNLPGTIWEGHLSDARLFAEIVNAHGGDVEILLLPDVGLNGNTHMPFMDMNNVEVASVLDDWLARKGLDQY